MSLYFKRIRYKNFLSSGNVFTEIDFTEYPSTMIIGDNGSGKSTLLDALMFGLYGRAYRKINKPLLINSINGKQCLVEIEFSAGQKEYLVRRGIKPAVFEIYQDGHLVSQDAATRDYQAFLEVHVLAMNYKSFSQIVVLGSSNYVPFMQLSAAARREIVEDLLDIQIFSVMNSLLKDRIQKNKSELIEVDHQIELNEAKYNMHKKHLAALKEDHEARKKKLEEQLDGLTSERTTKDKLRLKNLAKLEKLYATVVESSNLATEQQKINVLINKLKISKKSATKRVEFLTENDTCPTCKQSVDPKFREREMEEKKSKLVEYDDLLSGLEQKMRVMESTLNNIREIEKQILEIQLEVKELSGAINIIDAQHRRITDEIENTHTSLSTKDADPHINEKHLLQCIAELTTRKKVLLDTNRQHSTIQDLLKDNGIKSHIIKLYVPVINQLINKYLSAMDFYIQFQLDETFNEKILSQHRDEFVYDSFSEGEKFRINLALLFTWRAVAKIRNSVSTNLLVLDEIFDSSLDSTGTEDFMAILQTLTEGTNIFVISHKTSMSDQFSNVLRFEKTNNFSRMIA